jgi:hypothetical protein
VAFVPFVVALIATWEQPPAAAVGDYAQYLLHAQALADGRAYSDIGYLYTDLNPLHSPPAQPPGWPILLAPLVALDGTDSPAIPMLVMALLLGTMGLAGGFIARQHSVPVGVSAAALFGTSLLAYGPLLLPASDVPFCFVVWLFIVVASRDGEWTWLRFGQLLALAAAGSSMRILGVAMFPALLLAGMLRTPPERRRALTTAPFVAAAGLGVMLVAGVQVPFLDQVEWVPRALLRTAVENAASYPHAISEATLYPLPWNRANDAYHVGALAMFGLGAVATFRGRLRSPLICLMVPYGLLLLVAPVREVRYLWPFYPVITAACLAGVAECLKRLTAERRQATSLVLLTTVVCAATVTLSLTRPPARSLERSSAAAEVFDWVRRTKHREPLRLLFENPRVLTLKTGVVAMPPVVASPGLIAQEIARLRITHAIVGAVEPADRFNRDAMRALEPLLPGWREIWHNQVYRVYATARRPAARP